MDCKFIWSIFIYGFSEKIRNDTNILINNKSKLSFANCWFGVVTGYIMELDTIVVEIIENSQAEFITFTVIRLRNTTANNQEIIRNVDSYSFHSFAYYPPVCENSPLSSPTFWLTPFGQLMVSPEMRPPVQNHFWFSRWARFMNSCRCPNGFFTDHKQAMKTIISIPAQVQGC